LSKFLKKTRDSEIIEVAVKNAGKYRDHTLTVYGDGKFRYSHWDLDESSYWKEEKGSFFFRHPLNGDVWSRMNYSNYIDRFLIDAIVTLMMEETILGEKDK
jgi:hypothetical protein